jgi:hypothetical protein
MESLEQLTSSATPTRDGKADMRPLQAHPQHLVLHLPAIGPTVRHGLRLAVEGVVVPWVLVAVLLPTRGLATALLSALGWSVLVLAVRWGRAGRMPGVLVMTGSLLALRCCVSLVASSAFVFLLQSVLGSCFMAALFVVTSLVGRPLTMTLARDFIDMPAHMLERPRVRRMFRDVGLIWGAGRLVDAGMSFGFLHIGVDWALFARGLASPVLLVASIGLCFMIGRRALAKDGIRLSRGPAAA